MRTWGRTVVRKVNVILLVAALFITVGGTVLSENSIRYIGAGLSLIIFEFISERVSLNERLMRFLDTAERDSAPTLHELEESLRNNTDSVRLLAEETAEGQSKALREIARTQQSLAQLEEIVSRHVVSYFPLLKPAEPGRAFHELRHIYALRGARVHGEGHGLEVDRNDSIRLWRDALIESQTWDALSSAPELWEDDEREISEGYQELQLRLGGRNQVRRVFVLDSPSEVDSRQDLLREQERITRGNVRWITREKLNEILRRRSIGPHPILSDLDFAVIDNSYVLWFVLDDNSPRHLRGSRLVNHRATISIARKTFEIAFRNGADLDSRIELPPDGGADGRRRGM